MLIIQTLLQTYPQIKGFSQINQEFFITHILQATAEKCMEKQSEIPLELSSVIKWRITEDK
ncbi:MAG TPA: hypothetical protein DCG57_05390 [Candidatus Riflebacteria bacterium]|jgi:hypothetical protein|nr:hypothetical protein [Candidatus Riflebacteria bacterium]